MCPLKDLVRVIVSGWASIPLILSLPFGLWCFTIRSAFGSMQYSMSAAAGATEEALSLFARYYRAVKAGFPCPNPSGTSVRWAQSQLSTTLNLDFGPRGLSQQPASPYMARIVFARLWMVHQLGG